MYLTNCKNTKQPTCSTIVNSKLVTSKQQISNSRQITHMSCHYSLHVHVWTLHSLKLRDTAQLKAYVWNQGLNIHVLHKSSTYIYTCRNASNCATFRLCKFICIYVHVYITGLTMLLNSAIVLLVTRRPSIVYHIYDSRVQSSHTQSHSADYNNYNDRLCTITTCTLNKQPSIIQISRLQDFSSLLNRLAK